jgi:hypothetical protein
MLRKLKWQISAARYNWCQGPVPGRSPTVEKHWLTVAYLLYVQIRSVHCIAVGHRRHEHSINGNIYFKSVALKVVLWMHCSKFLVLLPLPSPPACFTVFPSSHLATLCAGMLGEASWNVIAHGDARAGKWRGNRWVEWVASTLYTTSEHGISTITTADAHTSAASRRLNWRPCRFKWTRPFRRKTKPGFCACAITFQTQSTDNT